MSLTTAEKKRYRAIGHELKPVVLLGNQGVTEALLTEVNRALNDHELIKVKIPGEDREARQAAIAALAESTGAEIVQTIGKVVLLLRRVAKPNPKLSNLIRLAHVSKD